MDDDLNDEKYQNDHKHDLYHDQKDINQSKIKQNINKEEDVTAELENIKSSQQQQEIVYQQQQQKLKEETLVINSIFISF